MFKLFDILILNAALPKNFTLIITNSYSFKQNYFFFIQVTDNMNYSDYNELFNKNKLNLRKKM